MIHRLPIALVASIVCVTLVQAEEPFRYPEAVHRTGERRGELRYINGLPVLTVEGTPEQMGEQIAVLAAKPAKRLLQYPREVLKAHQAELAWPLLLKTSKSLLPQFPEHHRKELDAMVAAGIDADLLLAGNTMFDIAKLFLCSAIVVEGARSATEQPLLARNLDFPTLGYLQEYSLVTIYRPEGTRHAFVSVGFPGMVGVISGMNDAGLTIAVLEVYTSGDDAAKFDPKGTPYALCIRRILEECETVEQAEKLLTEMKRTTMINLAVCDRKRCGVLEVTPRSVVFRKPQEGLATCTNHFLTRELAPARQRDTFETLTRYKKLADLHDRKTVDREDVRKRLHDANLGEFTLQTMIFEPATLRLHLAIGKCPASELKPATLELEKRLNRK